MLGKLFLPSCDADRLPRDSHCPAVYGDVASWRNAYLTRVSSRTLFLRSAQEKWSAMYKGNPDRLGLLIADHQDKWNCSTGTDRRPVSRTSLKPSIFKKVPRMGQFGSLVLLPLLSMAFNIPIFETPKIATTLTHFYFETSWWCLVLFGNVAESS